MPRRLLLPVSFASHGILPFGIVIQLLCNHGLLEVVDTLGFPSRFASRLDGGQEQSNQRADDGDYHQKFNQSKTSSTVHVHSNPLSSVSDHLKGS